MAKETPSPHEVRLALLDTNPVFHCLGDNPEAYSEACQTPKMEVFAKIVNGYEQLG